MTGALGWLAYEPEDVRPGWVALGLVVALGVVTYLLWRSMNTQLGKIQMPPNAKGSRDGSPQPSGATSESAGAEQAPIDDDTQRPPDARDSE